ncbi:septum formation initiator family protein [Streptomyces sp. NBC_01497]|uniref:septum formation initiator family protein n=1 Tax=Streptomyces sp. NBC_01497 TaxID=2903885 RepID=UPI002E32A985|nr:septum formation initiator family protein [Streptomyces sp. NBC_01497]
MSAAGQGKELRGRAARLAGLLPSGAGSAARTPFVLLVVLLLAGGLITLLLLNSSLNEGSFRLSELKKQTQDLTDEQQALQRDVDDRSAPDALAGRARMLGMVPGGNPAFLEPDGTVLGRPTRAHALPLPALPRPAPTATPAPSGGATPTPGATPSGGAVPSAGATPSGAASATAGATAPGPGGQGVPGGPSLAATATPSTGAPPTAAPPGTAVPLALTGAATTPTTSLGR